MPKLKQAKIIDKAENLLANLAKGRRVGNKTGKLKLTEEQQNKAELLKALDDMEKSRQLNESKRIMGALDTIFKQDLYKLALKLYENNQIGYSCRDLAVFNKQQPNQPVPASTLNVPFDVWIKTYFFNQIWKCFQEFNFYITSIIQKKHLFGCNFKIYDFQKITWSPIDTKELEIIIFDFFETNKNFKMIETLFRFICKRLNDYILLFNKKNNLDPWAEFKIQNFILNGKELKLIDDLTYFVKQQIMMLFPEYRELYEKYLKPQEAGKKWIDKVRGKTNSNK